MIVDTHLHIIDKAALPYPWLEGVPALNRDFLYADYAREAERAGITDILHMEVDVADTAQQSEVDYIKGISTGPDCRIRGAIAACRPEDASFKGYLERQAADPFVCGFRRVLHVMPDGYSTSQLFRDNIKRMENSGLTFDLCVLPHQIPDAIALADLAPGLQFILDHCGVPDIKGNTVSPWRENIAEIAKRANVTAKISGVVAYADPQDWTVETLRPWVEHTIASFGWDRVVWGSDWPVCTLGGGLTHWLAATHALLAGCSNDERTKLLSANAKRIWRL